MTTPLRPPSLLWVPLLSPLVVGDARIAHGHTVGHSPTQRIAVEHRPSPVDPGETVIAIDLPDDFGSEP